jgi:hypothetical protein
VGSRAKEGPFGVIGHRRARSDFDGRSDIALPTVAIEIQRCQYVDLRTVAAAGIGKLTQASVPAAASRIRR